MRDEKILKSVMKSAKAKLTRFIKSDVCWIVNADMDDLSFFT